MSPFASNGLYVSLGYCARTMDTSGTCAGSSLSVSTFESSDTACSVYNLYVNPKARHTEINVHKTFNSSSLGCYST